MTTYKIAIEPPSYWGDEQETSYHILLTVDDEQRSQRLEDWENSSDSFGPLSDIIPSPLRNTIEAAIDKEVLSLHQNTKEQTMTTTPATPTKDEIIKSLKADIALHSEAFHLLIGYLNDTAGDVRGWYVEQTYQSSGDLCWLAPTYGNNSDSTISRLTNNEAIAAYIGMIEATKSPKQPKLDESPAEAPQTNQPFKAYLKSITSSDCHHSIDHNFRTWADDIEAAAMEHETRWNNGRRTFSHEISKTLTADGLPHIIDFEIRHYHNGDEISEEIYSAMLDSDDGLSSSEPSIQYWWEDTPVC